MQLRRHHLLVMDKPLAASATRGRPEMGPDRPHRTRTLILPIRMIRRRCSKNPCLRSGSPSAPGLHPTESDSTGVSTCGCTKSRKRYSGTATDISTETNSTSSSPGYAAAAKSPGRSAAIADYRALAPEEQDTLHTEVRDRIPGAKAYSNWRDVGLHTFSLFSLGTGMVREGTRLLLTAEWVGAHAAPAAPAPPEAAEAPQLRIPEPPEVEDLLSPPAASASNDGADAESFVAKVLRSQGWEVAFYTNRRRLRFRSLGPGGKTGRWWSR